MPRPRPAPRAPAKRPRRASTSSAMSSAFACPAARLRRLGEAGIRVLGHHARHGHAALRQVSANFSRGRWRRGRGDRGATAHEHPQAQVARLRSAPGAPACAEPAAAPDNEAPDAEQRIVRVRVGRPGAGDQLMQRADRRGPATRRVASCREPPRRWLGSPGTRPAGPSAASVGAAAEQFSGGGLLHLRPRSRRRCGPPSRRSGSRGRTPASGARAARSGCRYLSSDISSPAFTCARARASSDFGHVLSARLRSSSSVTGISSAASLSPVPA